MCLDCYESWIRANVKTPLGKCREWSAAMAACFPELRLVRGHYVCPAWGEREHWWLTSHEYGIIDPTAEQFPSKGLGEYKPWDESKPEPTGRCPNCGGYCYNDQTCCSDGCGREYAVYCLRVASR